MLRLDIVNDGTGTHEVGNYRYYVYVTDTAGNLQEIARGNVKGHKRSKRWYELVIQVANNGLLYWSEELKNSLDKSIIDNVDIWQELANK